VTRNGRRNRIGFIRRRLLREAENRKEQPLPTFEPDPDAAEPIPLLTPEVQKAVDDIASSLNNRASELSLRMEETRKAILDLRLQRDVALRAVVLAAEREERAVSALKYVRSSLRNPNLVFPSGRFDIDRIDRVVTETLRDLNLLDQIPREKGNA